MKKLLTDRQMEGVIQRLSNNLQVRRTLEGHGRLHIDRQLPFICIYRRPADRGDHGMDRIAVTTASYLFVDGERRWTDGTAALLESVIQKMVEVFGAFLVLEVWASTEQTARADQLPPRPTFKLHHRINCKLPETLEVSERSLLGIKILKQTALVETCTNRVCAPTALPPLFTQLRMNKLGIAWLGLEIEPIYVDPSSGEPFPIMLRSLCRQIGHVLDQIFYGFVHECTTHQPRHYHMLGRRAMVKAVREADQRFDEIGRSFDLLQLATPINVEQEWGRFKRRRFQEPPRFLYRPSAVDPGLLKARLYSIRIDRVEDPTLMNLFLDKQRELDRQLSMIMDRHKTSFLYGSLQLYGRITEKTLRTARNILEHSHARLRRSTANCDSSRILELAQSEIDHYRNAAPGFTGDVQVSNSVYAGLLVSQGRLLIGEGASVPAARSDALIQHEVGTHVVTYSNGRAQPFKMLAAGLPGYDGLQEGLAVLAEYLVGGLDAARLRLLAIRVVAVHAMVEGATFIEVFRLLTNEYGFSQRSAYMVAMRVFRGGGLTKDAIYLKGLMDVLKYLGEGNPLEPLFAGKFALNHVPVIEELMLRKVLAPPAVLPLYLNRPEVQERMAEVAKGIRVTQLVAQPKKTRKRR